MTSNTRSAREGTPPVHQYAALCWRRKKRQEPVEVLVVTSRDTGRWIIPKGWPIEGKKSYAVAEQEAYEEAGVRGKASRKAFGYYHYLKGLDDGSQMECRVQVHTLEVGALLKDFPEKDARRSQWVSCEEAAGRVDEPDLKQLLMHFLEHSQ